MGRTADPQDARDHLSLALASGTTPDRARTMALVGIGEVLMTLTDASEDKNDTLERIEIQLQRIAAAQTVLAAIEKVRAAKDGIFLEDL